MKIKLIKPVLVVSNPSATVGQVVEAEDNEARLLIAYGDAMREPEKVVIETRDPEPESRDVEVKPTKRAKSKLP